MDYEAASTHILRRLRAELPANCYYHNYGHTEYVLRAAETLARSEKIADPELLTLIRTAAVYHDCGFIEQYSVNEPIAARIAGEVLPGFGYSPAQIATVQRLIMVTAIHGVPSDLAEKIIKDADFDYLGTEQYETISDQLRLEWSEHGMVFNDKDWTELQERFLESHRYYTDTALQLREPVKQQHIAMIRQRMGK